MNTTTARQLLPPEEQSIVTDAELRCGNNVTDKEFRNRIAMPWLIGQPARSKRGDTRYSVEESK